MGAALMGLAIGMGLGGIAVLVLAVLARLGVLKVPDPYDQHRFDRPLYDPETGGAIRGRYSELADLVGKILDETATPWEEPPPGRRRLQQTLTSLPDSAQPE